ncbi:MAG: hypothetical protein M0Z33_12640 [Actinomycetota bacterium]|nr:hypothetical protein [Actinomycetota bacterium]
MERVELDPIAEILVQSYFGTASYSRQFNDEHQQPPTAAAKAHHLRSVAQALINQDNRLRLDPEYAEYGRLSFMDVESGETYLVRSSAAVRIEAEVQARLFDMKPYLRSAVTLLVYRFHELGVDLSSTGTRQVRGHRRLVPSGTPEFVGMWPYATSSPPPFDQGPGSAWDDLGELGHDAEQEGDEGEAV